jgi:hypothetical protein
LRNLTPPSASPASGQDDRAPRIEGRDALAIRDLEDVGDVGVRDGYLAKIVARDVALAGLANVEDGLGRR